MPSETDRMAQLPRDVCDIDPADHQGLEDWATRFLLENRHLGDDWPEDQRDIVKYLRRNPGAASFQIADALALGAGEAADTLATLIMDGWISREEGGYHLSVELQEGARFLTARQLARDKQREIYNPEGVPDPSIAAGIFNRTHPRGRKVNSEKAREGGASFYQS